MRPPPETRADAVPQYSSAPHLLDAKLAWLNRHVWLGAVHIVEEPMRLPKPATWFTFAYELPGAAVRRGVAEEQRLQFTGRGATIHEAVARLVVAVADANYPAEAAGGVT